MHAKSLLLAALAVATVSAGPQHVKRAKPFGCSAPRPTDEQLAVAEAFGAEEEAAAASGNVTTRATINVDVYFHVVAASTSVADGYATVRLLLHPSRL